MKRLIATLLLLALALPGCAPRVPVVSQPDTTAPPATAIPTTAAPVEPTPEEAPTETTVPETLPPDPLELLLSGMSLEEKVGQMFLARCPSDDAAAQAEEYHLGGYILFGRDFSGETAESVQEHISSYQAAARIPMLIAVDEEGGTVTRVSCYSAFRDTPFTSPRSLYDGGGLEAVLAAEAEKCALLGSLGIQVNMAPVCDISLDPEAFMYDRSLGQPPEITAEYAASVVSLMSSMGIGSVLKHFPGYGENSDTHIGIARDSRSIEELESRDLIPFAAGIQAGCGAILVSHTIVECLDPEYPASLSPAVHAYIRESMGYMGVILTDDLVMEAITDLYGAGEAAVMAVLAGNDLLCSTDYPEQYAAILEAARDGTIPAERIDEAVMRILRWKQNLGLL